MRKLVGGAVAVGLAVAGSVVLAGPGSAQEEPVFTVLEAHLAPTEVEAGDEVTVTPTETCSSEGLLIWALYEEGDFAWGGTGEDGPEPVLFDFVEVDADGSWEVVFEAPSGGTVDDADGFRAAAAEPGDDEAFEVYGPVPLQVGGDARYQWFAECFPLELPEYLVLDAEANPEHVSPGEDVTFTPVDNCSLEEGTLEWAVFQPGGWNWEGTGEGFPLTTGFEDIAADGSWEVVVPTPIPDEGVGGEIESFGAVGAATTAAAADEDDPYVVEVYGPVAFEVGDTAYEWFGICSEETSTPELEAEITSHENHPVLGLPRPDKGDTVIIEPIDPCPVTEDDDDYLYWEVDSWSPDEESTIVDAGYLEVTDEGDWTLEIDADEFGVFVVWLDCENSEEITGFYGALTYVVGEAIKPPTGRPTEPAGPKPAHPITGPPNGAG